MDCGEGLHPIVEYNLQVLQQGKEFVVPRVAPGKMVGPLSGSLVVVVMLVMMFVILVGSFWVE